ncbi:MAG TPA: exodeoxyribonuclease VII small subunit [Candidatus Coatesbacteria bacterium]|nr:exodeoxyribonuclease VII small subunit [Candidatus Coatesbacteria bacterium]
MTFEAAMERLEAIVAELEGGGFPLDRLISLFEEGLTLARFCQEKLDATERRLTELVKGDDGAPTERPLDLPDVDE